MALLQGVLMRRKNWAVAGRGAAEAKMRNSEHKTTGFLKNHYRNACRNRRENLFLAQFYCAAGLSAALIRG